MRWDALLTEYLAHTKLRYRADLSACSACASPAGGSCLRSGCPLQISVQGEITYLQWMQEEQDAELRFLEDNSTAFEDQDAPAEQERPQPQEVCLIAYTYEACTSTVIPS